MRTNLDSTISPAVPFRPVLALALIAALLLHGLALGGLIWFSPALKVEKPGLIGDLHWISMVEPAMLGPVVPEAPLAQASESRVGSQPPELPAAGPAAASGPIPVLPSSLSAGPAIPVAAVSLGLAQPATSQAVVDAPERQALDPPQPTDPTQAIDPMQAVDPRTPMERVAHRALADPPHSVLHPGPAAPPIPASAVPVSAEPHGYPRSEASSASQDRHHNEGVLAALPAQSRRTFDVYLGDFSLGQRVASMEYLFEFDELHYRLRTEGRATGLMGLVYGGLLTQDSRGRIGPEGLLPERYTERRGERAARFVTFDRATGLAEADDGATQPLAQGVQDQLSAFWQLALIARLTPTQLASGHELRWPIARGRRVHPMRIVSLGEEILHPAHSPPIRTLHLALTAVTEPEDGRIDVWLASDDAMQPIRMKIASAQGLVLDQILRGPN